MSETSTVPVDAEAGMPVPVAVLPHPAELPKEPDLQPLNDETLTKQLQVQMLDASHGIVASSIDQADAYISRETSQSGVAGVWKRVIKGNIARDYIRQREITKNRQQFMETGRILTAEEATDAEHDEAMQSIVNRFSNELLQSDETAHDLVETEAGRQLDGEIRKLINDFASDATMSVDQLKEEKIRLLSEYGKGRHAEDRNKGLIFADNITDVAIAARTAVRHGVAIDRISKLISTRTGEAQTGQQTEVRRTRTDKIIDKLYQTRAGSLVNETTLAAAVGIAAAAASFTGRKFVSTTGRALGLGIFGGAVTGALAGAREHARVGQERNLHLRERAVNADVPIAGAHAKRREQMETTRYETMAATDLIDRLAQARNAVDAANPATTENLVAALADIEVRSRLSDEESKDFIHFTSKAKLESERLDVMRSIAEAKVALRQAGVSEETYAERSAATVDLLREDITVKDQLFTRIQRNRTMKMVAAGAVSGLLIGEGIQEARALISDQIQGIFDGGSESENRRTLLAALFRDHYQGHGATHAAVSGHETTVGKNLAVGVPDGYHLQQVGQNWQLLDGHHQPVGDSISLDANGGINQEAIQHLQDAGVGATAHTETITSSHMAYSHETSTPTEYMQHHPEQFTTVHRELWYDNNTPNIYDHNELGLHWGGANGTGMDANGNYVLDVHTMLPDGSYHDQFSADYQQLLREGKLSLALSFDRGSQSNVMMVHFDVNGKAIINADSYAARSLFSMQDGQAHFNGAYAEAVQMMGPNKDGGETIRSLATVVGDNQPKSAADTISHVVTTTQERHIVDLTVTDKAPAPPVEIPIPLPIYSRAGLEYNDPNAEADNPAAEPHPRGTRGTPESNPGEGDPAGVELDPARGSGEPDPAVREGEPSTESPAGPRGYEGYYGGTSPEQRDEYTRDRSPRLEADPRAILNPAEELSWHRGRLGQRDGGAYLAEIDDIIANNPVLRELGQDTKAIICIPVGAAYESNNIYNALSCYAQQEGVNPGEAPILLHVNWVDGDREDPALAPLIQRTLDEIERAQTDFPDLAIATMTSVWDPAEKERRQGVIGLVAGKLFDTAMMAAEKAKTEGRHDPDQDVLVIRNDADAQGLSRHYVQNMLEAAGRDRGTDAFTGFVRWETSGHDEFPGFAMVSSFREVMHAIAQRAGVEVPTIGINTAFRASTFAAVGGLGDLDYAGAASDDLQVGWRIYAARNRRSGGEPRGTEGYGAEISARLARLAGRYYSGYAATDSDATAVAEPIKFVGGTNIDTASARVLGTYRSGQPITNAWEDFSGRSRNAPREIVIAEERADDPDRIIETVEMNIASMGNVWFRNPAYMELGLSTVTGGGKTKDGEPIYTVSWENGQCSFAFTEAGRVWLAERMPGIGTKARRVMYHERQPGDNTPLLGRAPSLVRPLT